MDNYLAGSVYTSGFIDDFSEFSFTDNILFGIVCGTLIRRCTQVMWWLTRPAILVQQPSDRGEPERSPQEEEPEVRKEEVEEIGEETERTGKELEARRMEREAVEERMTAIEEEEEGTEAQENSALQSSSHEDPLEEISLEEIEQQIVHTQQSILFSKQLQKEHREFEMHFMRNPYHWIGEIWNMQHVQQVCQGIGGKNSDPVVLCTFCFFMNHLSTMPC
ncbi:hypothetical protein CAEBREN_17965 [Caenorhabditis brenneri]|uniref:Uncharacterized protein n=1 Tax=Caenorhabditis brenneri TaxID=135651 RepID=G0ND10_CAEBE|nr:hypothetical protein CAEBREN_17965 [Caenorhabditis brenneri]